MSSTSPSPPHALPPTGFPTSRGRRTRRPAAATSLRDHVATAAPPPKPSLLSRLAPRVDDESSPVDAAASAIPKLVVDPTSPASPSTPKARSVAAGLPTKPSFAIRGAAEGSRVNDSKTNKLSSLTVSTNPAVPVAPRRSSVSSSKPRAPGSAPPERTNFPASVQERPASALAAALANQPALRESSPTPRLSWADDTEDDSLPDLDDWNVRAIQEANSGGPEQTDSEGEVGGGVSGKEQGSVEDGDQTPVAEVPSNPGPPRERRKRGAGKKNKNLAKRAALGNSSDQQEAISENAVPPDISGTRQLGTSHNVPEKPVSSAKTVPAKKSSQDNAASITTALSALSMTSVDHHSTPVTPKVTTHSVLPDPGSVVTARSDESSTTGAAQLMEALAASIATMRAATPARPPGGGLAQSIHATPAAPPKASNSEPPNATSASPPKPSGVGLSESVHAASVSHALEVPTTISGTDARSRGRPNPRPLPSSAPLPRKPASTPFASRAPPRSFHTNPAPSAVHSASNGNGANDLESPMALPRKHARPVITADAITRLARGLNRDREAHT